MHIRSSWLGSMKIVALAACTLSFFCLGCGGGDSTQPAKNEADQVDQVDQVDHSDNSKSNSNSQNTKSGQQPRGDDEAYADKNGRKWIGKIPYDVWFDNPLAIASNTQPVTTISTGGANDTPDGGGSNHPDKPASPNAAGSSSAIDWKTVIPMEVLVSEVKRIRNRFTRNFQTPATYKSSYLEMPPHIHTLTLLAGIVTQHSESVSWKENAKFVRDLSASMVKEKMTPSPKFFNETIKPPYEQIIAILNGDSPAGLPESSDETNFSKVAEFGMIMKRMELAYNFLKIDGGNEDAFKTNADELIRESHVLAAAMKALTTEGYGYFDDEDFLGFANPLIDSGVKMAAAAASGDFETFDTGLSRVYKSCTQCHTDYRG